MDDVRGSDPLTDEDLQRTMALFQMMMASKTEKPPDLISDYLAAIQRQNEADEKEKARRSQFLQSQSLFAPPGNAYSGGQNQSGFGNIMGALNTANTASNIYNGQSLGANIMSLFA